MNNSFEYASKSINAIKQSHFQCTEDLISHILDCNDVEKGTVIELFKPRKKFMEFYEILDRKFFPKIERDIDIKEAPPVGGTGIIDQQCHLLRRKRLYQR